MWKNKKPFFISTIVGIIATAQVSSLVSCSKTLTYKVSWHYDAAKCFNAGSNNATINPNEDYVDKITYKPGYVFNYVMIVFNDGKNSTKFIEYHDTKKSELK
jgi:hypothetical protein